MTMRLRFVSAMALFQAEMTYRQNPGNSYPAVDGGHTLCSVEFGTEIQPGFSWKVSAELLGVKTGSMKRTIARDIALPKSAAATRRLSDFFLILLTAIKGPVFRRKVHRVSRPVL